MLTGLTTDFFYRHGGAKNAQSEFLFCQSIKERKIVRTQIPIAASQEIFFVTLLIMRHTTVMLFLKGGKRHGRRILCLNYR